MKKWAWALVLLAIGLAGCSVSPSQTPTTKTISFTGAVYQETFAGQTANPMAGQTVKAIVMKDWQPVKETVTTTDSQGRFSISAVFERGQFVEVICKPLRHRPGLETYDYNSTSTATVILYPHLWDKDWLRATYGSPEDVTTYSASGYYSETWFYYSQGMAFTFNARGDDAPIEATSGF